MSEFAFGFLEITPRTSKPRQVGLTVAVERDLSLRQVEDVIEVHAPILDYVKIPDFAGLISRYSADWIQQKTALYRRHDIGCLPGGIAFEIAALQGKVTAFFERSRELGFTAIEVSEDSMPNLPPDERRAMIREALGMGLEVFTEIGKKIPDQPLDLEASLATITADLELGVKKVVVEKAELAILQERNPQLLVDLVQRAGPEHLCLESGPGGFPEFPAWLIRTLGPDVNLENVEISDLARIEGMRRGLDRAVGYEFLVERGGRVLASGVD